MAPAAVGAPRTLVIAPDLYTGKAENPTARRIGGFYQLAGGTSLTALDGDGATLAFTYTG